MVEISTADLDRRFGTVTMQRGREYATSGHVIEHHVEADGERLDIRGSVSGGAAVPYRAYVRVEPTRRGPEIWATCTCPVQLNCKHAAALMIAAQAGGALPGDDWSSGLADALDALDLDARPPVVRAALGLRFEVSQSRHRWNDEVMRSISLRPVQVGKLGKWITTGCNWKDLPGLTWDKSVEPDQVAALSRLQVAMGTSYGGVPDLGGANPMFWPALRHVLDTGVQLVAGTGVVDVDVRSEPMRLSADLTEDEGELVLDFRVEDQTEAWPVGDIVLIGARPHGVLALTPAGETGPRRQAEFALTLAPLRDRLPEHLKHFLRKTPTVRVPAASREEFDDDFLPRLRRHVPTTSRDGSVVLVEEAPPRLTIEIDWSEAGAIVVRALWEYAGRRGARRYGIDSGEGLTMTRRPALEDEILAALKLPPSAAGLLCDTSRRLRAETRLRSDDLLDFVAEGLPALRAGVGYQLIETGTPVDYRLAEGEPEISFELGDEAASERTDWLDLEVLVRVDGHQVALGMILEALTRRAKMIVLHSGLHVPTDHPSLHRLAELVAAAGEMSDQEGERLRVGRSDVGLWGDVDELGVVAEAAASWVRSARALKDFVGLPEVDTSGLASTLRPYQQQGAAWLTFLWESGLGGILADDMGLGKTLQTLAVVTHARSRGAGPFLVVAPTSVVGNWALEAARHAPGLSVGAVTSTKARRDKSIADLAGTCDIVVTSYTLLRLEEEAYAEQAWGGLVLDEAQQIKNHRSRVYRSVRAIDAPFRIALTGTPFENRLMEMWSLLSVVAPGMYPSPARFRESVVRPIERGDQVTLARFRRRIRPFLLRRTKELVAPELPPKQDQVLAVTLGDQHRGIYDTHLQRERQNVMGLVEDFEHNRVAIFRSLTRLRQLSLDAALVDEAYEKVGSAKIDVLVEHLAELAGEGHRALVFSQFTGFLGRVRARLDEAGIDHCYLDGATRNRDRVIDDFRSGAAPAFLISLKAGGTGLTLTEADYVFVLDPWWNPATEAQAIDRAHRIGQQRPVMVYRLVASDTIEDKVMALKERKSRLFAQVMSGEGIAEAAIGADDVRALFGE